MGLGSDFQADYAYELDHNLPTPLDLKNYKKEIRMGTLRILKKDDALKIDNIIVSIYGLPGHGKTTIGLTAQDVLVLDFDKGIHRAAERLGDVVQISSWEDIADLSEETLAPYKTIVIDVLGKAIDILGIYLIKTDAKNKMGDGLSLKGWGAVKTQFNQFMTKLRTFKKDIVILAHCVEDKGNKDNNIYRIEASKSAREVVYQVADLMGMLYKNGTQTMLTFEPTDNNTAKNSAKILDQPVPDIKENNHFLADIIAQAKENLNKETAEQKAKADKFNVTVEMINCINNLDSANAMRDTVRGDKVLTNKFLEKTKELGFVINKETKLFELPVVENKEAENA